MNLELTRQAEKDWLWLRKKYIFLEGIIKNK
jgi:hypothetical protein